MRKVITIGLFALPFCSLSFWLLTTPERPEQPKEKHSEKHPANPVSGNSSGFKDPRDGQHYEVVKIGTQTWMAENLNYGKPVDNMDQRNNGVVEKTFYQNDSANAQLYGALYTWEEASNYATSKNGRIRGVCPQGWHLPSDQEWSVLLKHLDASVEMKKQGWSGTSIRDALNSAGGFRQVYGGNSISGWYFYKGRMAYYWTSTRYSEASAWYRSTDDTTPQVYRGPGDIKLGMCVRCLKDE